MVDLKLEEISNGMSKEVITEFEVGERLDKTLAQLYPDYSRSSIEKLIESRDILVNGQTVKTKYLLRIGDAISVDFSELKKEPDEIELPIIYEDESVITINKPAGILAHSKGAFNREGTVATFIHEKLNGSEEWKNSNRAGIVHRLDRRTSGVMICAKNEDAQKFLQKQFASRKVKKTYRAIISDTIPEKSGLIDVPIERNPKKPATFRAGVNGKPAQTEFRILKQQGAHSLIGLKPKTGRTHQLRVHLNYLGCPIVGDELYKGEPAVRLMLHALELTVALPNGKQKSFSTPMPEEFNRYF